MAWQSSSAMAGNGGMGGGNADGVNGGHPQGTEYTLQGKLPIEIFGIYRTQPWSFPWF